MSPHECLIDDFCQCLGSYNAAASASPSARRSVQTYFPPTLVAAMATVPLTDTCFWTKLMASPVFFPSLSADLLGGVFADLCALFAPVHDAYYAALDLSISSLQYTALVNNHINRLYDLGLLDDDHAWPSIRSLVEQLARQVTDPASLAAALEWGNHVYGEAIIAHAPVLISHDLITVNLLHAAIGKYRRGHSRQFSSTPIANLLPLFLENPHLTPQGLANARDAFVEIFTPPAQASPQDMANLSRLAQASASCPVPQNVKATLLAGVNRGNCITAHMTVALDLHDPSIIDAHITRAKNRKYLESLTVLSRLLSKAQWRDMMLSIVSVKLGDIPFLLDYATRGMPTGSLSPILPQFLSLAPPSALPHVAAIASTEDWPAIMAFFKKRPRRNVAHLLLAFADRTTPPVRSLIPRPMLLDAIASVDAETRRRMAYLVSTPDSPLASPPAR